MSDEEVKVGSFNKPTRKPMPGKVEVEAEAAPITVEQLNEKLDSVLKHLQAIDWKMWVYLKANNYID